MKLAKGKGSPETGGCWMALNDYYARGVLDWTDQPECVDPIIRPLAIRLNDWCEDGEREALIGPHVWTTMGTFSDELRPQRLRMVVDFTLTLAAKALDAAGVSHELRPGMGYVAAAHAAQAATSAATSAAAYIAASHTAHTAHAAQAAQAAANAANATSAATSAATGAAHVTAIIAVDAGTEQKQELLQLILDLCALGTPQEVTTAVTKSEALKVVCKS